MIQLTTIEAMQKAIDKARNVKPFVKVLEFRRYEVRNRRTGATYTVRCEKRNGARFADCTCKAGARGMRCYHVAAAVGAHIMLAAAQRGH